MTRDDAIKEIDNLRNDIGSAYDDADQSPMWYALGMAIEALQERKTGKWIIEKDCEGKTRTLICPFCKWKSGIHAWEDYNFCPNCGAKMEGYDE